MNTLPSDFKTIKTFSYPTTKQQKLLFIGGAVAFLFLCSLFYRAAQDPSISLGTSRRVFWMNSLPAEIKYLLSLASLLISIVFGSSALPRSMTYLKVTNHGIIYKNLFTLFTVKLIPWKVIDSFVLVAFENKSDPDKPVTSYVVRMKLIKEYSNFYAANLGFPGDQNKNLSMLNNYLKKYKSN